MSYSEEQFDHNKPKITLTEEMFFGPSGKPTLEFALQAKEYVDRMCESTGKGYFKMVDDVVRSVYAFKNVQYKKDHRFWLYKNRESSRAPLSHDESHLVNEITELARLSTKGPADEIQSDADSVPSQPDVNQEERRTEVSQDPPKPLSIRDGCPIHRKDCRTWRYKSVNKKSGEEDVVCEWYKKYTRWKAVVRGKRTRFSSVGNRQAGGEEGPRPAMKSATVVDYADNQYTLREPELHYNDGIGAPLNKKSAAYYVGMPPGNELVSSDSEHEFQNKTMISTSRNNVYNTKRTASNNTLEGNSDGSQSSGSETNLRVRQEVEQADEILAMKMYQAELNGNPNYQDEYGLQNGYLPRNDSNNPPSIQINEIPTDEEDNLNTNRRNRINWDINEDDLWWSD